MSTSADTVKELTDIDLTEEQIHLLPKLPGQTTDATLKYTKVPTRQVFEYAYKNFTDGNSRKYLQDRPFNHGCISEGSTTNKITPFQY